MKTIRSKNWFVLKQISLIPNRQKGMRLVNIVSNVGKVILSKDKTLSGRITHEVTRYCAICKKTHTCYIVKWSDGHCTKPCKKAVVELNDEELIMK